MKYELGGTIIKKFVRLRAKTYSCLRDDGNTDRKSKGTKNCVTEREQRFKPQQRFKSEAHNAYTEEVNNIALSSNDRKRLQTYDRITSYPYGTSAGKYAKQVK